MKKLRGGGGKRGGLTEKERETNALKRIIFLETMFWGGSIRYGKLSI